MNKREIPKKLFLLSALTGCLLLIGAIVFAADGGYVGSEKCKECHAELAKAFSTNIHAKAGAYGVKDAGCESCHGAAGGHVASGDKSSIINPSKVDYEAASAACLKCHTKDKGQMFWHGSIHEGQGLSCVACHKVHGGNDKLLAKKNESDLCFTCHADVRADMFKRSKHPMRDSSSPTTEGKMTCSSCHNAHGAKGEKLIDAKSFNDKCYECHSEKKAPLLWEHSPVKEDCLTCHSSHGSSNDKMLVTKVPRLCQECHMQGRHQTGTLGTNSVFAFSRGCLNCHPMVHGSNNPSGPVLQR
ncbi:DmsE family decaheme c-type cytochrome [Geotalea uraniireducens]|uniref:Cytochrome C family protein n=1 Tax=Geotalea uraniireducens (strain Rf4) TaxID=351605 RepID=A5G7L2_GEOUR|nr:DmsE family decaheme c-type cytochrome [Geotalea uraniireducens]ABQ27780.1 cytochrome C family protein [Geotalea uraniireducens Rf4]